MSSIYEECRAILRGCKTANDNRDELRLLPQRGVDVLIAELERVRLNGHVYEVKLFPPRSTNKIRNIG